MGEGVDEEEGVGAGGEEGWVRVGVGRDQGRWILSRCISLAFQ